MKKNIMKIAGNSERKQTSIVNKSPVFYGWIIMAAGTFGIIMTSPGQTYSVSIFIEHIIEDLGISRSLVSTLYMIGTLVGSLTLPFWGRQIDRKGTRMMVVVISVLFGLASIYMGFVRNAIMLGMGFIMVRMLGQGSLGLVSQTVINQWWVQKRGAVMGISGLLAALLGMGAFPNLVYALIAAFDWRVAYAILGFSLLLVMAPIGYFLFRNRPEDYHLQPDGASGMRGKPGGDSATTDQKEDNWTLNEAMHTVTFWMLIIALSTFSMVSTGLFFHMVSIFNSNGLSPTLVATVFVPVAIASAAANLFSGYMTDRIPMRYLLSLGLLLQAGTLILAFALQGAISALIFGSILGATSGISRAAGTIVWPSFFGRKNTGSITGFSTAVGHVGAAFGPLPFGFAFDRFGSYQSVLFITAAFCIFFCLMALSIKKPMKKNKQSRLRGKHQLIVSN